ncbi:MAG: beta-N-acetylhexosaminidase [Clostridium sp.]|nr:beta-N-acetylhexosaminidase [Clostridium sp.]
MKNILTAIFAASVALTVAAKTEHILPRPQQIDLHPAEKPFVLSGEVALDDPTGSALLRDLLTEAGCSISPEASRSVRVTLVDSVAGAFEHDLKGYPSEAYRLEVTPGEVRIEAVTPTGAIRAAQTLRQMAEGWEGTPSLEAVTLTDWPAFRLRGYMHDVGRSFIPADELVRHVELLGRFKVNTFHWHLTENQAWRFEVEKYPALTDSASMTRFPGMYYTREDIRRIMEAAARQGMTVIPEIDMPGHSAAFERAMGFEMQTPEGKQVLLDVLGEVAEVFSESPYIHIGGDEKEITDTTFLQTMTDRVHDFGKMVVCWNPIHGVRISADDGFDMTQMWSTAGRVVPGIPNIDCRYNYTNHFDVFADLAGIYRSSIYYTPQGTPEVAGTISAPWNDRLLEDYREIINQNNFFANVLASAERGWIGGGQQYIEEGGAVLPTEGPEFEEFADWERRFLFHKDHSLASEPIPYVRQTDMRWLVSDPYPNGGDPGAVFPPEESLESFDGIPSREVAGAGVYLRHTWPTIVPGVFGTDGPGLDNTVYAFTTIESPEEQTVEALIEFQNYSRSERDLAPDRGTWDRKGSRIWLNGVEIEPPVWDNSGLEITNEIPLLNENFPARPAVPLRLRKGANHVMVKLPYVATPGVRLNKWMFTFALKP